MTASRLLWASLAAAVVVLLIRTGPTLWQKWQLLRGLLSLSKGLDAVFRKIEQKAAASNSAADKTPGELVVLIESPDPFLRDAAASELAQRGVAVDPLVLRLASLLGHRERGVRIAAACALRGAGKRARPHVEAIGSLLDGADDEQTNTLLLALQSIGGASDALLATVATILATSENTDVRTEAVKVLQSSHRDTALVRTAMLDALARDTYASVRAFAALGLGWLPADERTTAALEAAREDTESWVRTEAEASLARQRNLGKPKPETPEETASAAEFEPGDALTSSLGIGRFVGLSAGESRDGFTVRTLLVELVGGPAVELPLACVGLRKIMPRADAERLYACFFAGSPPVPPLGDDEPPYTRGFAELVGHLTGDACEDEHLYALRSTLRELAFVLERDEAALRGCLAERYPELRDRIIAGTDEETS